MDVPNELVYNFLLELKRKDIDPIERAKIIEAYCEETGYSIRGLAKELGVSKSTIHYWSNYAAIKKKDYNKLKIQGFSEPEIHNIVSRCNENNIELSDAIDVEINNILMDTTSKLKKFINNPSYNESTIDLIKDLRNTLNRIELHVEKRLK